MSTTYSPYFYAGARLKALEQDLLTEAQVESLISAPTIDLAHQALQDTFIGSHLPNDSKQPLQLLDITKALDQTIIDTKTLLQTIAPEPNLLDLFWTKYDFHNLRLIIRGQRSNLSDSEIDNLSSPIGTFTFASLQKAYQEKKLALLDYYLYQAALASANFQDTSKVGIAVNMFYFEKIKHIANLNTYPFISEFVSLLIDLFNLQTSLRLVSLRPQNSLGIFVSGGQFRKEDLETVDNILANFSKLGNANVWKEAIELYQKQGHHTLIKKTADDYISQYLKEKSRLAFTPAALFSYFSAKKNNVQTLSIIIAGKHAGLPEKDIRLTLRQLYK